MDFNEFMTGYEASIPFSDLVDFGPLSQRLARRVGDREVAKGLIASNFWRAFIGSDAYLRVLKRLGASPCATSLARTIVVPDSAPGRFDLLVLDPGLNPAEKPSGTAIGPANFSPVDLLVGARHAADLGMPAVIGKDFADLALETAYGSPVQFGLTLAPLAGTEFLGLPDRTLRVDEPGGEISTAGLVVRCKQQPNTIGVTAALHAVQAAGASVTVDGIPGTILRSRRLYDAAFIELSTTPTVTMQKTVGIMSGMLPRGRQQASFTGEGSQATTNTVITGWDADLPVLNPHRQAVIYTGRDAQHGDSGAALVTSDDWIVGFALERSGYNCQPAYCSWVWAKSVLDGLDVHQF